MVRIEIELDEAQDIDEVTNDGKGGYRLQRLLPENLARNL